MMTESEIFVSKQIRTLVPNYDSVELKATVSSSSFSVEFFITISGKKMQCFEMIDKGMFTEKNFNIISKAIANHFRGYSYFNKKSGKVSSQTSPDFFTSPLLYQLPLTDSAAAAPLHSMTPHHAPFAGHTP